MRSKKAPFIFLAVLALLAIGINKYREYRNPDSDKAKTERVSTRKSTAKSSEINRNRGFDRRTSFIEYTAHAKCRMDCRQISQAEVEEIMKDGKLNYRKSNVQAHPCPIYALEGITKDKQRVRIVFGQCDYKTKVITVIDLEKDWACDCRGDESKYKNN